MQSKELLRLKEKIDEAKYTLSNIEGQLKVMQERVGGLSLAKAEAELKEKERELLEKDQELEEAWEAFHEKFGD